MSEEKKKLKKRSEADKKFTWAIEDLFSSDELWTKEYQKVKEMLPKVTEYKGRLSKSGDILFSFLQLLDEVNMMFERVYVYAKQKYHEDTANATYQDLSDKADTLNV
jgi:oligoendopeptidase F